MGLLANSDGSAQWTTLRGTRMLSSVNGPLEVRARDELPQEAALEVIVRPNAGLPTTREVLLADRLFLPLNSVILRQDLPRSLIEIVVQILETSTSFEDELAGSLNVITLALVGAGIPLSGLLVGIHLVVQDSQIVENTLKDWNAPPPTSRHAVGFKFCNGNAQLVLCESSGQFTQKELLQIVEHANNKAYEVYDQIRRLLSEEAAGTLRYLN